jgi:hypothetical protein
VRRQRCWCVGDKSEDTGRDGRARAVSRSHLPPNARQSGSWTAIWAWVGQTADAPRRRQPPAQAWQPARCCQQPTRDKLVSRPGRKKVVANLLRRLRRSRSSCSCCCCSTSRLVSISACSWIDQRR